MKVRDVPFNRNAAQPGDMSCWSAAMTGTASPRGFLELSFRMDKQPFLVHVTDCRLHCGMELSFNGEGVKLLTA